MGLLASVHARLFVSFVRLRRLPCISDGQACTVTFYVLWPGGISGQIISPLFFACISGLEEWPQEHQGAAFCAG
jgi:hypothetical protein